VSQLYLAGKNVVKKNKHFPRFCVRLLKKNKNRNYGNKGLYNATANIQIDSQDRQRNGIKKFNSR
jgi:hypothetical protein